MCSVSAPNSEQGCDTTAQQSHSTRLCISIVNRSVPLWSSSPAAILTTHSSYRQHLVHSQPEGIDNGDQGGEGGDGGQHRRRGVDRLLPRGRHQLARQPDLYHEAVSDDCRYYPLSSSEWRHRFQLVSEANQRHTAVVAPGSLPPEYCDLPCQPAPFMGCMRTSRMCSVGSSPCRRPTGRCRAARAAPPRPARLPPPAAAGGRAALHAAPSTTECPCAAVWQGFLRMTPTEVCPNHCRATDEIRCDF